MEIKDDKLTINIPNGMEIDIENCDLKNGIIKFKKKELRYEDIENYLDLEGNRTGIPVDENNAFKLCATDRLMNIARYYNGVGNRFLCQKCKDIALKDLGDKNIYLH